MKSLDIKSSRFFPILSLTLCWHPLTFSNQPTTHHHPLCFNLSCPSLSSIFFITRKTTSSIINFVIVHDKLPPPLCVLLLPFVYSTPLPQPPFTSHSSFSFSFSLSLYFLMLLCYYIHWIKTKKTTHIKHLCCVMFYVMWSMYLIQIA